MVIAVPNRLLLKPTPVNEVALFFGDPVNVSVEIVTSMCDVRADLALIWARFMFPIRLVITALDGCNFLRSF
jgi:hypothetical protein